MTPVPDLTVESSHRLLLTESVRAVPKRYISVFRQLFGAGIWVEIVSIDLLYFRDNCRAGLVKINK